MDDADRADDRIEEVKSDALGVIRRAIADMPAGEAGECDFCGESFARIVNGACGRCRDKYGV